MQNASIATDAPPDTEKRPPQQPSAGSGARGVRLRFAVFLLLGLVLLGSLVLPATRGGLWDPFELETAELARRAAVNLFGAADLVREGAENSIPTVEEVGRGELPLLSIALSLKLFGSSVWALRLPLLLWGFVALFACYQALTRLVDRRLGATTVIVLATCPMFFLQMRTALGDIATIACSAVAFSGTMIALFDPRGTTPSRLLALLLGGLGMAGGLFCRGALIGVALPAVSVGLTWWIVQMGREPAAVEVGVSRWELGVGFLLLGVGGVAAFYGTRAALLASPEQYWMALGSQVNEAKQLPTHDVVVHALGHGMFPWSAAAPLALGFALRPTISRSRSELAVRVGLSLLTVLGVACYGALAPRIGWSAFAPLYALAGLIALTLLELDQNPRGLLPYAMITAALLLLFYIDYQHFPEKGFSGYGVEGKTFPTAFKREARIFVLVGALLGVLASALLILRSAFVEVGLPPWLVRWRRRLGFEALLASSLGQLLRRATAVFGRGLRFPGAVLGGALAAGGLVGSVGYYPALAAQLSPVGAFDAYLELARPGEPLGVAGSGSAPVFVGGSAREVFKSAQQAFDWLVEKPDERRWLVAKSDDLATLNGRFRRAAEGNGNLPVLDARSAQALLVTNLLREGEVNQNPLQKWLPKERPSLRHPVDVELESKLRVIGFEIRRKRDGAAVDQLQTRTPYEFVIGYEVLARLSGAWQTFIHLDGEGKRFNGDHDTLNGEFPFRNWSTGDFILDIYEFEIESSFTPGPYQIYFGLFTGDKRMTVSAGEHSENRIKGGVIPIVDR